MQSSTEHHVIEYTEEGLFAVYYPFDTRNFSLRERWDFKTKTIYKKSVYRRDGRGGSVYIGARVIEQIIKGPFKGAYLVAARGDRYYSMTLNYKTAVRIAVGFEGGIEYRKTNGRFYVKYSGFRSNNPNSNKPRDREWARVFGPKPCYSS